MENMFDKWKQHNDKARTSAEQWFLDAMNENHEMKEREKLKQQLKAEILKELEIQIQVKAASNIRDEILKALSSL